MSRVLLCDTNVWSHLVLGTPAMRAHVQARLAEVARVHPGCVLATSRLCIAEALVAARRLADADAASSAEAALQVEFRNPNLLVVEVSEHVLDRAATLRAQALQRARGGGAVEAGADGGKLKLPDAVVVASCLEFDPPAVLVTQNLRDFTFLSAEGLRLPVVDGLLLEPI